MDINDPDTLKELTQDDSLHLPNRTRALAGFLNYEAPLATAQSDLRGRLVRRLSRVPADASRREGESKEIVVMDDETGRVGRLTIFPNGRHGGHLGATED